MTQYSIEREKLRALPYVSHLPTDGRIIFLLPFKDKAGEFRLPFVMDDRIELMAAGPAEASYVGDLPDDPLQDLDIPLLTTLVRHLSFAELREPYQKLEHDIVNCGAFIEKYFVIHRHYQQTHDLGYRAVMASEFEGLMVNARALYDQLQFFFRALWKLVRQEKKRELPESFQKLATTPEADLRSTYNLPLPFVKFVIAASQAFVAIRDIRVAIEHHGRTHLGFYCLEQGFAVDVTEHPWNRFDLWPGETLVNGRLGSYLLFLSRLTVELLTVIAMFDLAIHTAVPLPPATTSLKVYLRSPAIRHLRRLDEYIANPWTTSVTFRPE